MDTIRTRLSELKNENSRAWLEIEYTGDEIVGNLREMLDEATADSTMEIRRVKNKRVMERVISTISKDETLDNLTEYDVFTRCLNTFNVLNEERDELTASYREIVQELREDDKNAE